MLTAGAMCQELAISLTMNPSNNGGKVVQNSTVAFWCTVNKNILGRGDVNWHIRQGMNRYRIGTGIAIDSHSTTVPRYRLETESQMSSVVVYKLTITSMYHFDRTLFTCICFLPYFYCLPFIRQHDLQKMFRVRGQRSRSPVKMC